MPTVLMKTLDPPSCRWSSSAVDRGFMRLEYVVPKEKPVRNAEIMDVMICFKDHQNPDENSVK